MEKQMTEPIEITYWVPGNCGYEARAVEMLRLTGHEPIRLVDDARRPNKTGIVVMLPETHADGIGATLAIVCGEDIPMTWQATLKVDQPMARVKCEGIIINDTLA